MTAKTATWLIWLGSCIAFLGLCAFPAAYGPNGDKTLASAGLTVLSMGMMLLSAGVYIKARALGQGVTRSSATSTKRGRRSNCDLCQQNEPVIQCRVHTLHLCGECLGDHYDFRKCAYVPSTRRSSSKTTVATRAGGALIHS